MQRLLDSNAPGASKSLSCLMGAIQKVQFCDLVTNKSSAGHITAQHTPWAQVYIAWRCARIYCHM